MTKLLSGRPQKWSWLCGGVETLFNSTALITLYYCVDGLRLQNGEYA